MCSDMVASGYVIEACAKESLFLGRLDRAHSFLLIYTG